MYKAVEAWDRERYRQVERRPNVPRAVELRERLEPLRRDIDALGAEHGLKTWETWDVVQEILAELASVPGRDRWAG